MKYLYLFVIVILLLQSLLVSASFIWGYFWLKNKKELLPTHKQSSISNQNQKELQRINFGRKRKSQVPIFTDNLTDLPVIKPLNCAKCGAGVLLKATNSICPKCETVAELPAEYFNAMTLKVDFARLTSIANKYWRVFDILTRRWVIWLFFIAFLLEIGMPVFVLNYYNGEQFLSSIFQQLPIKEQNIWDFGGLFCLIGIVTFAFIFLFLAVQDSVTQKDLRVRPILDSMPIGAEVSNCQTCGGANEYLKNEFSFTCNYCNVENFRVQFAQFTNLKQRLKADEIEFSVYRLKHNLVARFEIIPPTLWGCGGFISFCFVALLIVGIIGVSIENNSVGILELITLAILFGLFFLLCKFFRILFSTTW